MFCPECGARLEVGSYKCTSCDWTWENIGDGDFYFDDDMENESLSDETETSNAQISKIGIFITIAVILVIVVGVVWVAIYKNSDGYKIKQATDLIASSSEYKIDDGLELIADIYTPQALAIKEFADVEMAKIDFQNNFQNNRASEKYNELKQKFNDFVGTGNAELLKGELKENFDCYRVAFKYASTYTDTSTEMAEALYNVQLIKLNDADINSGDWFTLNDLQNRIDDSLFAIGVLNDYDGYHIRIDNPEVLSCCWVSTYIEGDEPGKFDEPVISLDSDPIGYLISECEEAVKESQSFVSEYSEKYGMYEVVRNPNSAENTISHSELRYDITRRVEEILAQIQMKMFYSVTRFRAH